MSKQQYIQSMINNPEVSFLETIKHLKKDPVNPHCFLLIEPHLLYLTDTQATEYLKVVDDPGYSNHVHKPIVEIIEANLDAMLGSESHGFSLIELGPGYPDMSLPMATYCKSKHIPFHYYAVDVNTQYLEITAKAISPYATSVDVILGKFEECHAKIPKEAYSRPVYLMIGLTFMNFDPAVFIPMLKKIAGPQARIIIASELITPTNTINNIIASYQGDNVREFAFSPLANLGIAPEKADYIVNFENSRVECTFILKEDCVIRKVNGQSEFILRAGEKIITAISYRYTLDSLNEVLKKYFQKNEFFLAEDKNHVVALNTMK